MRGSVYVFLIIIKENCRDWNFIVGFYDYILSFSRYPSSYVFIPVISLAKYALDETNLLLWIALNFSSWSKNSDILEQHILAPNSSNTATWSVALYGWKPVASLGQRTPILASLVPVALRPDRGTETRHSRTCVKSQSLDCSGK